MFTRAYYTMCAAAQAPVKTVADTYSTTISDKYLNCKNVSGTVRNIAMGAYINSGGGMAIQTPVLLPFGGIIAGNPGTHTSFYPDEVETAPSYEDYAGVKNYGTGWSNAGSPSAISTLNDDGSITVTAQNDFKNTSGSSKTVYGVNFVHRCYYRNSATSSLSTSNMDYFLVARERFDTPVVVPDNSIIQLTVTYTVRKGEVTSLSVS